MKKRIPVSKIMTPNPYSVNITNTLYDVQSKFNEYGFHHIPVVSGKNVIGIVSRTDIDRVSFISSMEAGSVNTVVYDMLTLEQVMTSDVKTVQQNDELRDVVTLFKDGSIHALPVLEGDDLVGIVTTTDIINFLLDQF